MSTTTTIPTILAPSKHLAATTAPSRGLSPSPLPRSRSPVRPPSPSLVPQQRKMPSPRSSPALRPQSPLSPRFEAQGHRFETLQPPSPRAMHNRATANSQRRANTTSLKLPSLPRYHPANFPSSHSSSVQTTPDATSLGSPQAPLSPRAHQRVVSDAQKHLLAYQREMISRAQTPGGLDKPLSPKLEPLGSPGPVTPLELEGDGGYLVAGARHGGDEQKGREELVEKLIREEARRQRGGPTEGAGRSGGR